MPNVVCPKCQTESFFGLSAYKGPFRCMKCKETFNITIENGEVKSYETITQQELDKKNIRQHYA
ncbi:MAG: hypothetical protein V1767_05390 [Chloroflexota bacterium]